MTDFDFYPTPALLAKRLVTCAALHSIARPRYVSDFAAGDGALLREAQATWPGARVTANDISRSRVYGLRVQHPEWLVTKTNFVSARSRAASPTLQRLRGRVDVCLLNPPFSGRGQTRHFSSFSNQVSASGLAMAFLGIATQYLRPDGVLASILPASCLTSERDARTLALLRAYFELVFIDELPPDTFAGIAARTLLVAFKGRHPSPAEGAQSIVKSDVATIVRGVVQMHTRLQRPGAGRRLLLHTTGMRRNTVMELLPTTDMRRAVKGPALVFPRVGRPDVSKVCVLPRDSRVVLSDCVLAAPCATEDDAKRILAAIRGDAATFASIYSGACAPYTTVTRAAALIAWARGGGVGSMSLTAQAAT